MNKKNLLSLYGIKWNPFAVDIPFEGIVTNPAMDDFCWRTESLVMDGGFAMITGSVGTGKSVALRWLSQKLSRLQDVHVAQLNRPQSSITDFYRELGSMFGLDVRMSNKWGGFRSLRDKWITHIDSTMFRPVLLIDEAQEMPATVLSELRLMSSSQFDSRAILTVVLCGDERLPERFRSPDLMPLGSRIKTRLLMEHRTRDEMNALIEDAIKLAGNPVLMTKELMLTLADKSMGNYRAMMHMADDLLTEGVKRQIPQLDQQLFLERFDFNQKKVAARRKR
jgi:general secretion pathway protein A